MIYKKQLKKRGWTDRMIAKYYPVPDSTTDNPFSLTSSMLYYNLEKVIEIEATEDFKKDFGVKRKKSKVLSEPHDFF